MKKPIFILIIILFILAIPYCYYCAIDTLVSLKYETEINECISEITSMDLCFQYDIFMGLTYFFGLILVIFLLFNKKIVKKK